LKQEVKAIDTKQADLIEKEAQPAHNVSWRDYVTLFSYGPGSLGLVFFLLVCILAALAQLATSFALGNWTSKSLEDQQSSLLVPGLFIVAVFAYILFNFTRGLISFCFISHATTNMNNSVCETVLRADILFFDANPVGRILTRFSKDIAVMDFSIAPFFIWCSMGIFRAITVTITIGIINPWLFIGLAISFVFMWLSMKRSVRIM